MQCSKAMRGGVQGRRVTLPPEAHREPSGETVTVLMYPVWPTRLLLSLQLVKFHTCTSAHK